MNVYCSHCGDGFTPIEGTELPVGAEEPQFCSDDCADAFADDEEFTELFWSAGDAAPVFP